ncbi:MAG: hypothetical protein ACOX81_05215 [Candidatus Heteroscillospira sp.]|jgi:Ca2+/H+ antiporter
MEKRQYKSGYITYQTIRIAVLICAAYEIYLRVTTGRPTSHLLLYFFLLTAPAQIYKMVEARNAHKGDKEELKKYDRMFLRCVLLAIAIVGVVVVATFAYAMRKY